MKAKKKHFLMRCFAVLVALINAFSLVDTAFAQSGTEHDSYSVIAQADSAVMKDSLVLAADDIETSENKIDGVEDELSDSESSDAKVDESEKVVSSQNDLTNLNDDEGIEPPFSDRKPIENALNEVQNLAGVPQPLDAPLSIASVRTSDLLNTLIVVSQGGEHIEEGGTLVSTEDIEVKISFRVPVFGDGDLDESVPRIQKGDWAVFELGSAFSLLNSGTIDLLQGEKKVGTVSLNTDVDKKVTARVDFDGDDEVFNSNELFDVNCDFIARLRYDDSGDDGKGGDYSVTFLGKNFIVTVPPAPIEYTMEKTATAVDLKNRAITWSVEISATQKENPIDLNGYEFFDDVSSVGDYVDDSFAVTDIADAMPSIASGNKSISYTFPENSQSPKTVMFKTTIPDAAYYANTEQKIDNTAALKRENETVVSDKTTATFTPSWIEKTGQASNAVDEDGKYNTDGRTITWYISVNQREAQLYDVEITDVLPLPLTVQSAQWQIPNGESWEDVGEAIATLPIDQVYLYPGAVNTKLRLKIVANVPDPDNGYIGQKYTYNNSASVRWKETADGDYKDSVSSGSVGVEVGYDAISKSGALGTVDATTNIRKIAWTITVDAMKQAISDLKVYDLLVYGSSAAAFEIGSVSNLPVSITSEQQKTLLAANAKYNQKYAGTLSDGGLTVQVYTLKDAQGRNVADLLEITGLSTNVINTFSFESLLTNPDIYAANTTKKVYNTATLWSGASLINKADAEVNYNSTVLGKEMLNRTAHNDPAAGVNTQATKSASDGFHYLDKSVIFRLSINASSFKWNELKNASAEALGEVTVTDTLPDGWEFVNIIEATVGSDGKQYLMFEGDVVSNGVLQAVGAPLNLDTIIKSAVFDGKTASFAFNALTKPYVILVKAVPSDDTLKECLRENKPLKTVTNNVALTTEKWITGVKAKQDVSLKSQVLYKTRGTPSNGELLWTVEYKPYSQGMGTRIEDILPTGIDLRTDSSGALLLDDNIHIWEMTFDEKGDYTPVKAVTLMPNGPVTYNNATRVLNFVMPDNTKAYRLTYLTDITGEAGNNIVNEVKLVGGSHSIEGEGVPYSILAADGTATMRRGGWIQIIKLDGNGDPLSGVEFTLFSQDHGTVLRKVASGSDGKLSMKALPQGNYLLEETQTVDGYTLEPVKHIVTVDTSGDVVTTSIDGKNGSNANILTVQNFRVGTAGNLAIHKTVAGNAADFEKTFEFIVSFENDNNVYPYIGKNGASSGTIQSGGTIILSHAQSITVTGLPANTKYTVTESDYTADGYYASVKTVRGTIVADATQTAAFVNTKNRKNSSGGYDPTGSLTVKKTVRGLLGERERPFTFVITFDTTGRYSYSGSKSGMIESGQKITLRHNEHITITGLPTGIAYSVTEEEANQDGYYTTATNPSGTTNSYERTAEFFNTRNATPNTGDSQSSTPAKAALAFFSFALAALVWLDFRLKNASNHKQQGQ